MDQFSVSTSVVPAFNAYPSVLVTDWAKTPRIRNLYIELNATMNHTKGLEVEQALSGIKVLDAAIINDNDSGHYPSDHFPVKAVVQF